MALARFERAHNDEVRVVCELVLYLFKLSATAQRRRERADTNRRCLTSPAFIFLQKPIADNGRTANQPICMMHYGIDPASEAFEIPLTKQCG